MIYFNRNKYIGEWKDDKIEGQGEMIYYAGDKLFIIFKYFLNKIFIFKKQNYKLSKKIL